MVCIQTDVRTLGRQPLFPTGLCMYLYVRLKHAAQVQLTIAGTWSVAWTRGSSGP
jgi:hypothetical protein